jgi:hypothetical protein
VQNAKLITSGLCGFSNALCNSIEVLLLEGRMSNEGRKSLSCVSVFLNRSESSRTALDFQEVAGSNTVRSVRNRRIWTVGLSCSGGGLSAFGLINLIAQLIYFFSETDPFKRVGSTVARKFPTNKLHAHLARKGSNLTDEKR